MREKMKAYKLCVFFKKPIISLVMLFLVVIASDLRAESNDLEKFKGQRVSILAINMPQYVAYWNLIPEFEKTYGIRVDVDLVDFIAYREKSLDAMTKNPGVYDIFSVDCMWLAEYVDINALEPLMPYIKNSNLTAQDYDVDDFVPRVFSGTGVYNDVVYGIPIGNGTMGQSWRVDLAADYGLTFPERFDGKWTTAKMLSYTKKLHHPEKGYAGFVTEAARWNWGYTFTPLLYTFTKPENAGSEFFDEEWKVTIDKGHALDALKWYLQLRPYLVPGTANFGYGENFKAFRGGKAAGTVVYSGWIKGHWEDPIGSKAAGKSVHLHTPVGPHGRVDPFFGSWGVAISTESKNKEAAWIFLQWLTSKKVQLKAITMGANPVRHSTYLSPELKEYLPWYIPIYQHMLEYANPDERPRIAEWSQMSLVLGLYGSMAWMDVIEPEKAVAEMDSGLRKLLKRTGYYNPHIVKYDQKWRDLKYYDRLPSGWK
jgi:multiple sugar transport system substrate-binding protein